MKEKEKTAVYGGMTWGPAYVTVWVGMDRENRTQFVLEISPELSSKGVPSTEAVLSEYGREGFCYLEKINSTFRSRLCSFIHTFIHRSLL